MPRSDQPSSPYLFCIALAAATVASALLIWHAWCEFPIYAWNDARLAPAFALRHGINPYPPIGGGPLSTWIYGPIGILVNLPATFASSAAGALALACLINFAVVILPLALIFFTSNDLAGHSANRRWLALTLGVLLIPAPNLLLQVADHTAIAFGLLSCWCLAKMARPNAAHLITAAMLFVLATGAKQIAVFLSAAQLAYLVIGGERTAAVKYLSWITLLGGIALGLSIQAFGWNNLWLNIVVIPNQLPWADSFAERVSMRAWPLTAQIGLPCVACLFLWRKKNWPRRGTESGRFFQIAVLASLAMLPVGIAAFLKIGGDTNLLHSWDYLFPSALLVWLSVEKSDSMAQLRVLVAVFAAILAQGSSLISLHWKPMTQHFKIAEQLAAAYPHAIWFPRNPVITYYADQKLWHAEDGIQTRFVANLGLREPDFRRYLPDNLQAVAYPASFSTHFSMPLLSELGEKTTVPHWTIYSRAGQSTSDRQEDKAPHRITP